MEVDPFELKVHEFFTQSRVHLCKSKNCKYNRICMGELECNLKEIEIDDAGRCRSFEPTEDRCRPTEGMNNHGQ